METWTTMESPNPAVVDRRRWPRQTILGALSVELRVAVPGAKPAVLLTRGVARDISCGGVNCAIDLAVPAGTEVNVRFSTLPAGVFVQPTSVAGLVVRTETIGGAPGRIAIAFVEPLSNLDLNGNGICRNGSSVRGHARSIDDIMGPATSPDRVA